MFTIILNICDRLVKLKHLRCYCGPSDYGSV